MRDPSSSLARLTQIAEGHVGHEVKELEDPEEVEEDLLCGLAAKAPLLLVLLRLHHAVDGEGHEAPVMNAVTDDVLGGHGIVGKSMHENSLQNSLHVVTQDHNES